MGGRSKKGAAWGWRRLALGTACLAGLAALVLAGSRFLPHAQAQAGTPPTAAAAPAPLPATPSTPVPAPADSDDYAKRPVAFIHDNEVVTREQLGEYLIARFGAERLPLLINKILIEEACRAKGIEVTAAEVEASFAEDLASMGNVSQADFADKVLKQYKKSLYEWKEDVIRPKLLMSKLVRDRVKVTEEDIQAGFEAYHGEKIDCQIIYWPKGEENIAKRQYAAIRDSEKEFDDKAKMQANSTLAAQRRPSEPAHRPPHDRQRRGGARGVQAPAGRDQPAHFHAGRHRGGQVPQAHPAGHHRQPGAGAAEAV